MKKPKPKFKVGEVVAMAMRVILDTCAAAAGPEGSRDDPHPPTEAEAADLGRPEE